MSGQSDNDQEADFSLRPLHGCAAHPALGGCHHGGMRSGNGDDHAASLLAGVQDEGDPACSRRGLQRPERAGFGQIVVENTYIRVFFMLHNLSSH
jgi:hypothetical protein